MTLSAASQSPIERRGNFFIVTADDGSKSYYRLKGENSFGALSPEATAGIAEQVFDVLKSAQEMDYQKLSDAVITHEGVQIVQKSEKEAIDPKRITIQVSDFDSKYANLTQIAVAHLPQLPTGEPSPPVVPSDTSAGPPPDGSPPVLSLGQQDRVIDEAQSPEAESISAFVVARLNTPRLFLVIRDLFIKLINSQQYTDERRQIEDYEVKKAEELIKASNERIRNLMNFDPKSVAMDKNFVYVSESLLNKREEVVLNKGIGAQVVVGKKGTKYLNKEQRLYKNVSSLTTESGIKVTGYEVKLGQQSTDDHVIEGSVIPTVFAHAKSKDKANHLANCYMTAHEKEGVIRHAVADTPEKVNELIAAARKLNADLEKPPPTTEKKLRIASHQLNTPTRKFVPADESKFVKNQHKSLAICEKKAGDVEFAHINTPCNRAYNWGKIFRKIGLGFVFPGETKSRVQNIEGMITYLNWVVEDLDSPGEKNKGKNENHDAVRVALKLAAHKLKSNNNDITQMTDKKNKIRDKIVEMDEKNEIIKAAQRELETDLNLSKEQVAEKKATIKEAEEQISQLGDEIARLRKELTSLGRDVRLTASMEAKYEVLKEIETVFEQDPLLQEHKETIVLLRKLLGEQLKIPGDRLLRGQQLMTFMLLDKKLGVISAFNCKSGLDRTGFVHAVILAMMDTPKAQLFGLVTNWDVRTAELNKKLKAANYDASLLNDPNDQAILAFRQRVMTNLLKISLKITVSSTGLIGLKWSKGMSANLIPLNFLPPKVRIVDDNGEVKEEQILTYDKNGDPEGFKEVGHQIFTQLSDQRGA
ncbi:MAG TPA: hypothetical protein VIH61_01330 [Waddliaceae bacterium]